MTTEKWVNLDEGVALSGYSRSALKRAAAQGMIQARKRPSPIRGHPRWMLEVISLAWWADNHPPGRRPWKTGGAHTRRATAQRGSLSPRRISPRTLARNRAKLAELQARHRAGQVDAVDLSDPAPRKWDWRGSL